MQPVHAGLLLRRGRRRPCAVSSRQAQQQDGSRVRRWCLPVSFGCWAPTGSDFPIPCPSDFLCQSCPSPGMRVSHALHRVCASVMPLTGYARQSCPSPGMRVSHARHRVCVSVMPCTRVCVSAMPCTRVCASVMPFTGYAHQSCSPHSHRRRHSCSDPRLHRCGVQLAPQEGT